MRLASDIYERLLHFHLIVDVCYRLIGFFHSCVIVVPGYIDAMTS